MLLFTKGKIGNLTIKNRIGMSPMGTIGDAGGRYTPSSIEYFTERAKGGMGLIITGLNSCTEKFENRPRNLLEKPHHAVPLSELVDKVHFAGAKIIVQIGPGLGRLAYTDPDTIPYSCSDSDLYFYPDKKCKILTKDDIKFLVERMAVTASLAKATGADGVELHGYGGYLMDQFHSTKWNWRTDEYGGSLENRLRFSVEIISAIKDACGSDFVVGMKYTPDQCMEGMRELQEGVEMAKIFEEAGCDFLHLDTGNYDVWNKQITTVYEKPGCQVYVAEAVRKAVKIPIIVQGKLNDPMLAEKVLQDGIADYILMGHQSLADPYWAKKVKEGNLFDIRPCIGCNECLYSSFSHRDKTCAVNVCCYHEAEYKLQPTKKGGSVLVIGGGPGGMNAALCAAERGFKVQLWEKTDKLGGMLNAAGAPSFKQDVLKFVKYLERQIIKQGVEIHFLKEATAKNVISGNFDHVVLACGAKEIIPPIVGIDKPIVHTAINALNAPAPVGKDVVVIGGGLVGCEVACSCAETAENVTIIEMLDGILKTAKHSRNNDQALRAMVKERGINIIASAKVVEIGDDEVVYEKDGEKLSVKADAVIISAGFRPDRSLEEALEDEVKDLQVIGDAVSARKVYDAVHEGYHYIRLLD